MFCSDCDASTLNPGQTYGFVTADRMLVENGEFMLTRDPDIAGSAGKYGARL